jgi:hypothetical protein
MSLALGAVSIPSFKGLRGGHLSWPDPSNHAEKSRRFVVINVMKDLHDKVIMMRSVLYVMHKSSDNRRASSTRSAATNCLGR